jgi:hypothetical protein
VHPPKRVVFENFPGEFPSTPEPVEEVAAGPIDGSPIGPEMPKIGVFVPNLGQKRSTTGVFQQPDLSLQHHLALPRSTASVLGGFGRILSIFIALSLLNTLAVGSVFSRSFRISDAVGPFLRTWMNEGKRKGQGDDADAN